MIANISMSLDKCARRRRPPDHVEIMIIGLALSVALMGIAATFIARILKRHHWISCVGLAVIADVTLKMIYEGGEEMLHLVQNGAA